MVAGSGSGGVDRIGGSGIEHTVALVTERGRADEPVVRQRVAQMYTEERIRDITNQRVRAGLSAGRSPGAASSVGKVHMGTLNQALQVLATDLIGTDALATEAPPGTPYGEAVPHEVHGMLRSRANTIEGGTTEVNKNILGERVLELPREPDPWQGKPWSEVPRS
jgi:alkylation response protein AidB-like acyl-CoA dehydrogenase